MMAALLGALLGTAAQGADRVYWGESLGKISFANLDGSGQGDLETGTARFASPNGLVIDPVSERLYWINGGGAVPANAGISFANLDGSGGGDLPIPAVTFDDPEALAIDPVGRRIYWANRLGNTIGFANLDGPGTGLLDTTGAAVGLPSGLAIDPAARRIYWINASNATPIKLAFADLDTPGRGGSVGTVGAPTSNPTGLAIDPFAKRVYWANLTADTIAFANLDGSGGGRLNTGQVVVEAPRGVAVDPFAGRAYWANDTFETPISFVNLDGSGAGGSLRNDGIGTPSFPILRVAPRSTEQPTISGEAKVGSVLSCSPGSWAPNFVESFLFQAAKSFSYQWSRNGAEIPAATQSSLAAADPLGGDYRCRVTAQNTSGATASTSGPHRIAPIASGGSGSAGAKVTLSLLSRRITAKGPVAVRVGNANPFAVAGKLAARSSAVVSPGGKRRFKLGGGAFKVAAGAKAIVKLKLPNPLRLVLARQRKLSISLSATVTDPVASSHTVKKTVVPKLRT